MLSWQITGLTNNSYFNGAHEVRHCVRQHPDLGHIVLEVAKVCTKEMNVVKDCFQCSFQWPKHMTLYCFL